MALDVRTAQTSLENTLRDVVLQALGRRLPEVASIAALRAVPTQGESSSMRTDDDLINVVVGGLVVTAFRWDAESAANDDGVSIIRPTDVVGNGRWIAWTSPVRIAPVVGGPSYFLHELRVGYFARVLVLDKQYTPEEVSALLLGQVPAAVIEASGDEPGDMLESTGWLYDTTFDFKVSIVTENLRAQREAAQAPVPTPGLGDPDPGANALDGLIQTLFGGVNLNPAESGIRNVMIGRGDNYGSTLAQRRVIRERMFRLKCTVENPPASNDTFVADSATLQARLTSLGTNTEFDPSNYVNVGLYVVVGDGLEQLVAVGSAQVGGVTVDYAGQFYTFSANSDTYRDLNADGSMTFTAVINGASPPPITSGALRVGVTVTDSTDVVTDTILAQTVANIGPQVVVPLED